MSLPKFDFSGVSNVDFEAVMSESKPYDGPRGFRPGIHDAVVNAVEFKGRSESDPSWLKVRVVLTGQKNQMISDLLSVPTKSLKMKTRNHPDGTSAPLGKLVRFLTAVGAISADATLEQITAAISALFSSEEALTGKNIQIEVGYRSDYISYDGKGADGKTQYSIVRNKEKVLRDGTTDVMMFTGEGSYKAAAAMAETLGLKLEEYTSVLKYHKSVISNDLSGATNDGF